MYFISNLPILFVFKFTGKLVHNILLLSILNSDASVYIFFGNLLETNQRISCECLSIIHLFSVSLISAYVFISLYSPRVYPDVLSITS